MAKLVATKLTVISGDSDDIVATVTDSAGARVDLSRAVDGTASRRAVVRFAVKDTGDELNADALIFKSTYIDSEVALLTQAGTTLGQCKVLLDTPDTDLEPDTYKWDLEVCRQDVIRTQAGTISVVATSDSVVGVGTTFSLAKPGDILQPLGVNVKPVKILEVVSDTELVVESGAVFTSGESGITFEIRRGRAKTVANGSFVVEQEIAV